MDFRIELRCVFGAITHQSYLFIYLLQTLEQLQRVTQNGLNIVHYGQRGVAVLTDKHQPVVLLRKLK